MRQLYPYTKFLALLIFALINGCTKDEENPFDSLDHPANTVQADTTSPSSITGLHKNIFSVKCAIPSCHGGTFEPDFRTVQSTYNTLVYQKVKKNTIKEEFDYRVIPYDTVNSWLHERITYDDSLIGRMPLYGLQLTDIEAANINSWIMNGARDIYGKSPDKPNENPKIYGYGAYDGSDVKIDGNRTDWAQPFDAPANQQVKILIYVEDDETEDKNLQGNILKLSLDPDDFSNAVSVTAVFKNGPKYWGWLAQFNTSQFSYGTQVYMRYSVKDPDHTDLAERPVTQSYSYTKNYFSFTIK